MPGRFIGTDDGSPGREGDARPEHEADAQGQAERFAALFRVLYLTYHRRDGPRSELPGASRAVLTHLAVTGPLTVGEAALHLGRAQSVVSEIVDGLARKGLLERERDPVDRRRTLFWLTGEGHEVLRRDGEVLAVDAIAAALARMPVELRAGLLEGASALLAAAPTNGKGRVMNVACESCSMPIESGRYCVHCTDADGNLQPFEERFVRMVGWQERRHPEQSRAEAEAATLAYMATMPAWRDHPAVAGRA